MDITYYKLQSTVEKTIKLSQIELFLANNTTQPLNAVSPTKIQSGIGKETPIIVYI